MGDDTGRAGSSPFPGLRPFRTDEHHLFFGREEQTAALLTLLRRQRFLAVVGTSGSGKSSLVRAGLIPALHRGTMAGVGSSWEVVVLRPGGRPLRNLALALVNADLYDRDDPETLPRLLATLGRAGSGLVEAVRQSDALGPETRLLVVVDQFEELFRFRQRDVGAGEEATGFVNLLLTASERSDRIFVAITMRSDYLGDCSTIAGLAEAVNRGEYLVPRLSRDQRRDAIVQPVGVGGGAIAPRLVQRLLNDVGDDPDQLPVLQHALMRTWGVWAARGDRTRPIDLVDFEGTGGMAEALSRHADEVYAALPDDAHRLACERAFRTLTEQGRDGRGIRRPTPVADLEATIGADRATVGAVLDAFRAPGVTLLMPGMDVELGDRTVIDLSHESLMRCWGRLRGWADDEARSARIYRRLSDTARLWSDGRAGLFQQPDLAIAESWRERERPTAAWAQQYGGDFDLAMRFLAESQDQAHAAAREREAASRRELEQARRLAEEQRLRIEEQQRGARRLRRILGGLAAVALVAIGTSVVAGKFWRDATEARTQAESSAESARTNATLAARNEATAQAEAQRANEQKRLAETNLGKAEEAERVARKAENAAHEAEAASHRLLYATDMQLAPFIWKDERATARQLAARLDAHLPSKDGTPARREDLRGFEWHYYRHVLESASSAYPHDGVVLGAAVAADDRVVTLGSDFRVRRWSPETRRSTDLPPAFEASPGWWSAAVSLDGSLAAVASGRRARVLDARTGKELQRLDLGEDDVRDMGLSADGRRLAVLTAGRLLWFDTGSGERVASTALDLDLGTRDPSVAVSADGLSVVVGPFGNVGDGLAVLRLDPARPGIDRVGTVETEGTARSFALSPDGALLAVGNQFGSQVVMYETATGRQIAADDSAHASPVTALAFSREGTRLATGSIDGAIELWTDPRTLKPARKLKGHDDPIVRVAFSADGRGLVSADARGTVRRWDLAASAATVRRLGDWRPPATARSWRPALEPVWSPDGLLIATPDDTRVVLVDAWSDRPVRVVAEGAGGVLSCAFSPDGRLLAVGRLAPWGAPYPLRSSTVSLWDVDTGERVADLGGIDAVDWQHMAYSIPDALAFTPDGRFLVVGFGARGDHFTPAGAEILRIWDVASGRSFEPRDSPGAGCVAIAFSADGRRMATCSHDWTARIWDVGTWSVLRTLRAPGTGSFEDVAFSPDGRLLATANFANTISLWDTDTGAQRATLSGHSSLVWRVSFSPDGRTLASSGADGTLRLWNVATTAQLMILQPGDFDLGRSIESLGFSPDGKQLVAAGARAGAVWSAAASPWDDPEQGASALERLLSSKVEFRSRVRMLSGQPRLHEALAVLAGRSADGRARAALAAARADAHAGHGEWAECAAELDRVAPDEPAAWLRTPALLRVAAALVRADRAAAAASLLAGGAERRRLDGLPTIADAAGDPQVAELSRLVDEGLAARPRDPGLLELRAELAGQWSGVAGRSALYTAAIDACSDAADGPAKAAVARLLRRRGLASLAAREWRPAVEDLSRVAEGGAGDAELYASRGRAYEGLAEWEAAAADAKRAASPDLAGARALAAFADRVSASGRPDLAVAPYDAAQRWYEQALGSGTGNAQGARELAELLVRRSAGPKWTVLQPVETSSTGGAQLVAQPDGSVLVRGGDPQRDVCSVEFAPGTGPIRAVRLEALPDSSLLSYGPSRGGGTFDVEFEVRSGNVPVAVLRGVATHASEGLVHLQRASGAAMRWLSRDVYGREAVALCAVDAAPAAGERLKLELRSGPHPGANLGRFRLSVGDAAGVLDRETWRLAASRLTRPWAKLAAAYRCLGDEAALDRIAARGPDAAAQVGDLFLADREWERAISSYDLALAGASDDGVVLAARAAAHAGAGRAERAEADWVRVLEHHPRLRPLAFGSLALAGRFAAAARAGDMLVAQNPRNVDEWLRAATAHALAGDKAAYGEFMGRMMRQFDASAREAGPFPWILADAFCRVGALPPDGIDLSRLPSDAQAQHLDAGLVGGSRAVWGWATRALVAHRKGDAASALRHLQSAKVDVKLLPPLDAAMILAVRALVLHALGRDDDARADAKAAAYISDTVLPQLAFEIGYQLGDRLTPRILVREAQSLLDE